MSSTDEVAGGPPQPLRETCRVVAGRVPLWPYHRARLVSGGCFGAVLDRADDLVQRSAAEWTGRESSRVRLTVTVATDGNVDVDVKQRLSSLDVPGGPIVARVGVPSSPVLPDGAAKPAERGWWDRAHRAAERAGAHQAIVVDREDFVVDGSTATVWIVESARLITPPAPPAIAGVARAFLQRAAPDSFLRVSVEPITWERFQAADEAFLTNAFGGAAAIRGRGGAVFGAVAELFDRMWGAAE